VSFIHELGRRNVFRAGAAYIIVSWLILQIADVLLANVGAPAWVFRTLLVLLGIGLAPMLLFAWVFELTPEGLKREGDVDSDRSITRQTGRKLDLAIIAALGIALAYFVWESRFQDAAPGTGRIAAPPAAEAGGPGERSIAVLPFVNMSAEADNEYFSDGVTEELLNVLSRLPELKVSSRTSAFAYRNKDVSIPTVAAQLGVKYVLEGSVRRVNQRVRITAQLIDAQTDTHLWSQTYDRQLEDIFDVQDEIAHEIVAALKVRLNPEDEQKLESPRAASIEAYDYYLRGRALWDTQNSDALLQAREMFEKAIEVDPAFAPAVAWLAMYHASRYSFYESDPRHLVEADRWSRRAVELSPQLDQAHIARGQSFSASKEYQQASREFERALQLNPRSAEAMQYYGSNLFLQGDLNGAAAAWERTLEVQPDNYVAMSLLPQVYRSLGQVVMEK
jgi:TolB-like protein/Tfp pilus assembly protein PilF